MDVKAQIFFIPQPIYVQASLKRTCQEILLSKSKVGKCAVKGF